MKIYQSEHDGVIGEFLYQTVEFSRKELTEGGVGVISQDAVRRYLVGLRPNLKVKKLGSFRFDSQENTVLVRIGTPVQKLLGPGYDELAAQVEGLKKQLELGATVYEELSKKYDALVAAVSKDVQKFSDLLVENEQFKIDLMMYMKTDEPTAFDPEDAVDLADAKEVIESADSVPLSKIELTGADGAKIEGEKAKGGVRGDRHKEIVVADISLSEESENDKKGI